VGKPRKIPTWFAFGEDRPLFAFSGLWTSWRGVRGPKSASVDGDHELFGFLTTEPNAVVAPIHPKAMPVILTTPEEIDLWLEGEVAEALKLQRPLPDQMLSIVARSEKEDPPSFRNRSWRCLEDSGPRDFAPGYFGCHEVKELERLT
jgi:putative SOS response-associated peptidase YedK